jgi:hypothetical protein
MTRRRVISYPDAVRLTEGLTHTGYTPETAIADLIDNSIAADATEIRVRLSKGFDGAFVVWIGDNGCGMDENTLIRAMQYGSSKELARNDLSVYGLGMKMASTSFSKRFTVVTREKNSIAFSATLDLGDMKDNPWSIEVGEATSEQIIALNESAKNGSGTVVIWEKAIFNIFEQSPKKKRAIGKPKNLDKDIENYLGLVFHKFMEGSENEEGGLQIRVNGSLVIPFNPVNKDFLDKEWAPIEDRFLAEVEINGRVEQVPYVLTTYKLNGDTDEPNKPGAFEESRVGMSTQGIYPYRKNRILQKPDWLSVLSFHPDWNTMRVTLDLDPRLDSVIRTDVKKSGIALTDEMWEELKNVLELYKSQIKKINKRRKDERFQEKTKIKTVDLHGGSNSIISTAGKDLPTTGVKRISPTEVEIDTIFGPSVTNIKDYTGPASRDSHIEVVDDLEGGILWEPRMNGSDQIILLNRSHPFYRKIYLKLRQNPVAIQGLDFLLYALANAEWMTRTDRAKEQFFQMRRMMADSLRTLVLELEDLNEDEYEGEAFSTDESESKN